MVSSSKFVILFFIFVPFLGTFVRSGGDENNSRCSEDRDKGNQCPHDGSPPEKKFYYNAQMGVCQPFIYKGCDGNNNRFDNVGECTKACGRSSKQSQWVLADKCNASYLIPDGHYIECPQSGKCPEGHICKDKVCCPTKEHVCSLKDDTGTFAEGIDDKPRFAWSDQINNCWRFSYYGAKGNYNNFPNFYACISFCKGYKTDANSTQ